MILVEIVERFRRLAGSHKPYVASKGPGRWTIRHYDSVLKRWTDSGQTFFNKRDAEFRLRESLNNRRG